MLASSLSFLAIDLAMDLFLLCAVQVVMDHIHPRRLFSALALLCAYTLLANLFPHPFGGTIFQIIACLAASARLLGLKRPRRVLEAAGCMLCIAAGCAGFALLAGNFGMLYLAGALLLLLLLRKKRHIQYRWNIEIYLEKDGVQARFPALIDTGNRLREHRSALPVLIAEADAMPELALLAEGLDPSQLRTLPFGVLGGRGEMRCFRPDHIQLCVPGHRWRDAPACWVAIFEGRIPGPTRALAPPEFAETAALPSPGLQRLARRFRYGVFKHPSIHLWPGGTNSQRFGLLHRRQ